MARNPIAPPIPFNSQTTFVSIDQLAVHLSLDRKTLYAQVKNGTLPGARRIGGRIRVHLPIFLQSFSRAEPAQASVQEEVPGQRFSDGTRDRPRDDNRESNTVASIAELVIEQAERRDRPSEVASKRTILSVHLIPAFGDLRLDALDADEIAAYVARKQEAGLAPATIRNHLIVLKKLLAIAHERGVLKYVPTVSWPKVPTTAVDFPSAREAERVANATTGQWRTMMKTAAKTGLRPGELRALKGSDVDLARGELSVRQSAWHQVVGPTKGGRPRVVPLSPDTKRILGRHLKTRKGRQLVFTGSDGQMLTRDELKGPLFRACKKAGTRQFSLGAFRHTYATELAKRDVPLTTIQQLLGHQSIRTTLAYTHLPPDELRRAVVKLDRRRRVRRSSKSGRKRSKGRSQQGGRR